MELNDLTFLNFLESLSQVLPCPAAFWGKNGLFLGCTHPSKSQLAAYIFQQCCASTQPPQKTALTYNAEYTDLTSSDGEVLCSLLLLDAPGRIDLFQPVQTLFMLHAQSQEIQRQLSPDSGERISFVYQLLSSRNVQKDALRRKAQQLHYVIQKPRVAILFSVDPYTESNPVVLTDFSTGEGQALFSKTLTSAPEHCSDDIGDFMNTNSFTLLKTIPQNKLENQKQYLTDFIAYVLTTVQKLGGLRLRVCAGSCYNDLLELRSSYEEALFLSQNFDFFAEKENPVLFIADHIYDYLISLLPPSYFNEKFSGLISKMTEQPALNQTLISLSQHNMNLRACAASLGLHRNTMLQRYEKIKAKLNIDPASDDRERMTVRQYALCFRKKTVIRAGVVIQNSNVLGTLYRKLAEQLYRNSDGEMELEIHTLNISGDNQLLFHHLQNREADIAVGNIDALIPMTGEQISIVNAPFLFDSAEQALFLLNSSLGDELLKPLADYGLLKLAVWSMGWRYFSSEVPFRLPEDLKDRQIRIMRKPLVNSYIQSLGATPCFLGYDKILPALEEGLIDMQENPYRNFYEMHFYRHQKHILEMNMLFDSNVLLTSSRIWEQLTPTQQQILRHSVDETNRWHRDFFIPITTDCRKKILKKGVQIHTPTLEEELVWRKQAKDFLQQSPYSEIAEKIERIKYRYGEEKK